MENRRVISYALFALGVVFFALLGLLGGQLTTGVVVGLMFLIGGIIFYRRGK